MCLCLNFYDLFMSVTSALGLIVMKKGIKEYLAHQDLLDYVQAKHRRGYRLWEVLKEIWVKNRPVTKEHIS